MSVDYNWNVFRYIADYLHLFGVITVLASLLWLRNCRGLSFKTQMFYLVIFCTRYLDLFGLMSAEGARHHSTYLILFKLFYIASAASIVGLMRTWSSTIETNKDTCSISGILIPCLLLSVVSSVMNHQNYSFTRSCWIFSEILEGFAMLPQYIFNYRQDAEMKRRDNIGVLIFILAVGSYRMFYAANWIYKKAMMGASYTDYVSWFGGIVEIILFLDYLLNKSFLKLFVLGVDAKINDFTDIVEMKILNRPDSRRIPVDATRIGAADDDEAMLII